MLELLTGALTAGAVAGVTGVAAEAINEAYAGLKNSIVKKFGKAKSAIDALEDEPGDEDAQTLVTKRLAEANVAADAEVKLAAGKLAELLKVHGVGSAAPQQISGDGNMPVAGNRNILISHLSQNNSGVNVQGSPMQGDEVQGNKVGRDKIVHNYNTAPELSAINTPEVRALVPVLNHYFSLSDIGSLCFEMGIDDEQLRGQTKDEKARSLAKYVEQNGRLDELKKLMRLARPNLRNQWD